MKVVFYRADFGLFLSVRLKTSVFSQKNAKKVKKNTLSEKEPKKIKKVKKNTFCEKEPKKNKKSKKKHFPRRKPHAGKCEVTKNGKKNHLRLESCFLPSHAPGATI